MLNDLVLNRKIDRRDFLKKTGNVFLTISGGLTLDSILKGCATVAFESQEDISKINWDANPIIPVPKNGCYLGWHYDVVHRSYGPDVMIKEGPSNEKSILDFPVYTYGKGVAAHSFSEMIIGKTGYFPSGVCDVMSKKGVFPIIRWYPHVTDFNMVANGKQDKILKEFAKGANKYGRPFFFTPFPEANIGFAYKNVHPWAGSDGKGFKKAWKHMHEIFDGEGANEYAVWGLHLIGVRNGYPYSYFAVDNSLVDWVGFSVYNLSGRWSRNFFQIINQHHDYSWAKSNYPEKPIALWEFGTSYTYNQGKWIKDAYKTIKKMPRIKLAVYAEYLFGPQQFPEESTYITKGAEQDYKEAISDPYFIGSKKL